MLKLSLLLGALAVSSSIGGCSATDAPTEHAGISRQKMVGGTVSTADQDSVVFLMKGQDESCSGSFIAPNLILTARHCVAAPVESTAECVSYGATVSASQMSVKIGASSNWNAGTVVAKGKTITTPPTANMCGFDVALIQLDRDVPNAKVAPVRFTALLPNEPTVTIGYGVDGNDNDLPKRMQRTTTVLGVGPAKVAYTMKNGQIFNYDTPLGDVVTGESTCYGDSGGPLLDMQGNIVAMTSRGPANAPTDSAHGNGCIDMVSVYAATRFNEATIRQAAVTAGHPLPAATPTPPPPAPGPGDVGSTDDADSAEDDDDTSSSADDTTPTPTPSKKKTKSALQPQAASCSSAPGRAMNGDSWLLVVGFAIVIAAVRRHVHVE
jgi:Trypsin